MRVVADCRDFPSVSNCSLTISGEEEEVVRAAAMHAVDVHQHTDSDELRASVRASLKPATATEVSGYGTTMIGRLKPGSREAVMAGLREWESTRHVPGFVTAQVLFADDGETVVNTAVFASREAYQRLADDPEQDTWYRTRMAPTLDGDPQWIDGQWQVYVRQPAIVLPGQAEPRAPVTT